MWLRLKKKRRKPSGLNKKARRPSLVGQRVGVTFPGRPKVLVPKVIASAKGFEGYLGEREECLEK